MTLMQLETQDKYSGKTLEQRLEINKCATIIMTGFNLKTCDSYFKILVKVSMNHISVENIFCKPHNINKTQDYGLQTCRLVPNYLAML